MKKKKNIIKKKNYKNLFYSITFKYLIGIYI